MILSPLWVFLLVLRVHTILVSLSTYNVSLRKLYKLILNRFDASSELICHVDHFSTSTEFLDCVPEGEFNEINNEKVRTSSSEPHLNDILHHH